jgi:hypothetical protein
MFQTHEQQTETLRWAVLATHLNGAAKRPASPGETGLHTGLQTVRFGENRHGPGAS